MSDYFHPMDQGYDYKSAKPLLDLHLLSVSADPFQHQTKAIDASLRSGASRTEITFLGSGKGNQQRFTPESMSKEDREEMRALAKLNKMKTSTHASPGMGGQISGFDGRSGFHDEVQASVLKELNKAIDFAAEATTGGAIVFHVEEFKHQPANYEDKELGVKFQSHEGERDELLHQFVDSETGQIKYSIPETQEFYEPIIKGFEKNEQGGYKTLYEQKGEKIETRKMTYRDIVNEEKNLFKRDDFLSVLSDQEKKHWNTIKDDDEQVFLNHFLRRQRESAEDQLRQVKNNIEYNKLQAEDARYRLEQLPEAGSGPQAHEIELARKHYEYQYNHYDRLVEDSHNQLANVHAQIEQQKNELNKIKKIEEVAVDRAASGIAQAAMHAMYQTQKHRDQLEDDLFIAPENYQPGDFGSNPDDMMKIIDASRQEMVRRLTNNNHYKQDEAEKLAKKHIRATIDIGHLNLWRSRMERKEGETGDQFQKRFESWIEKKTKQLAEGGYMGHVHIADNMGYDDEHLSPGQGNAHIRKFVEIVNKADNTIDMVIEPGSFNGKTAFRDGLAHLNSRTYFGSGPFVPGREFRNVNQMHFGYTGTPRSVFGTYSPSDDFKGAPYWSGVQLE